MYIAIVRSVELAVNNLYMFVTSKCFLVPITTALSTRIYYSGYLKSTNYSDEISMGYTVKPETLALLNFDES